MGRTIGIRQTILTLFFLSSEAFSPSFLTTTPRLCAFRPKSSSLHASNVDNNEAAPTTIRLEDRNVPTAHLGLHDDLYGDGEAHGGDAADNTKPTSPSDDKSTAPAPTFNGKMVLPLRIVTSGLQGHKIAAVYAILNDQYQRGSGDGWEHVEYVGISRNLDVSLRSHVQTYGSETVAHVRALSFGFPKKSAMEAIAKEWRENANEAGGSGGVVREGWAGSIGEAVLSSGDRGQSKEHYEKKTKLRKAMADPTLQKELEEEEKRKGKIDRKGGGNDTGDENAAKRRDKLRAAMGGSDASVFLFDEDDDDDEDDDLDWSMEVASQSLESMKGSSESTTIISPFSKPGINGDSSSKPMLEFTMENVDQVLNEVRPYLIADGGNVSVQRICDETKNVYLVMEGACGSCPSSTVTMQMGIERVLKENFDDLGQVLQVEDLTPKPTELTVGAVEEEVKRLTPAILAMGGVVEIGNVDPIGEVEIRFRGSNKVRHGLELALLDVPLVKNVKFIS